MDSPTLLSLFSLLYAVIATAGILTAVMAVHETRTPQGAIAWALSLITFPLLALPLYWIFGRAKFNGYAEAMRAGFAEFDQFMAKDHDIPRVRKLGDRQQPSSPRTLFEMLADVPFLGGNDLKLLIDGQATFDAICESIEQANRFVLVQFYIFRDDSLGRRLRDVLVRKARESVEIFVLYDEIGCHKTSSAFFGEMREAGIAIHPFHTTKGRGNRFQINFRNHRKVVVVDGHTAFVGGHNVGDEYLGGTRKFPKWRDTHLRIAGPACLGAHISFAKDWYWATGSMLDLALTTPEPVGDEEVLALGTGPDDPLEPCAIMFIRAINAAQKRFWVASPYFVPDTPVLKALQMAALRGVDVRILMPGKTDGLLPHLAGYACLDELDLPGVRVFRYKDGFLHQKVFLVDDVLAGVGTANLDNRSLRLNFELTMLVETPRFCRDVENMFLNDLEQCEEVGSTEYRDKNLFMQTAIKFARLLAPVL